jgi:hypothetical protein
VALWTAVVAWAASGFWEPLRPYQRQLQLITFLGAFVVLPLHARRALDKRPDVPDKGEASRTKGRRLPPEKWGPALRAIRARLFAFFLVAEAFILVCIVQTIAPGAAAEAWYGGAAALVMGAGAAAMLSRCPRCGNTFFNDPKPGWSFRAGASGFGVLKSGLRLSSSCGSCGLSWRSNHQMPAG